MSNIASSDDGEDVEHEDDEESEEGQLSEDDEPGWVMGNITEMVQQHMERIRQKQMKVDELTQPGLEDAADHCRKRDKKYGTSEMRVPAVVQPHTDDDTAAPAPTTFGKLMDGVDIVLVIGCMPQGTSRQECSLVGIGSGKPQSDTSIPDFGPSVGPILSPFLIAKPVEPVSFYSCIYPPQLITI